MPARIVLLVTSPRLPAGLLSAAAWDLVRGTPVFAAAQSGQTAALAAAGVSVTVTDRPVDDLLAAGDAGWLAGPAGDLVDKMVRRNPHVFGDAAVRDIDDIMAQWQRIKNEEKPRDSVLDGVPLSQPALALAAKVLARVREAGLTVPLPAGGGLGERLLRTVAEGGADAEGALRAAVLSFVEQVRIVERG